MVQTPDEIARDIMVAWLSGNNVSFSLADAEKQPSSKLPLPQCRVNSTLFIRGQRNQ
jgi:hypothetical protein